MSGDAPPRVERRDGVGLVRVGGAVDIVRAHELRNLLLDAVSNEDAGLVIDLSEATYLDSVGVSVLFELAERLGARQLRLAVVIPAGGLIERVVTIVNLGSVAELRATVDEAVEAVGAA